MAKMEVLLRGLAHMAVHMNPEYAQRMIQTLSRVLMTGKNQSLFDDEVDGYLCVATKQGNPVLGLHMGHDEFHARDYRDQAEEQIRWLSAADLFTSSLWLKGNTSQAVAATGYDFYLSYASGSTNRLWNEAIVVVTAIRIGQFNETVTQDPRWHLKANPNIESLLAVAHWTE